MGRGRGWGRWVGEGDNRCTPSYRARAKWRRWRAAPVTARRRHATHHADQIESPPSVATQMASLSTRHLSSLATATGCATERMSARYVSTTLLYIYSCLFFFFGQIFYVHEQSVKILKYCFCANAVDGIAR